MSNRKILAIIIGAILIATTILVTLGITRTSNQLTPTKTVRDYYEITSNIQNYSAQDKNIFFFTGAFFAKYNLETKTVDRLSDYVFIDNEITDVDWSDSSVLFQTPPFTKGEGRDDIWVSLFANNMTPYESHWWKYDFANNQYQLLAMNGIKDCTHLYHLGQDKILCQQPHAGSRNSTDFIVYSFSGNKKQTLVQSKDPVSDVKINGDDVYFISSTLSGKQNLHVINIESEKETIIHKANDQISSYITGDQIILTEKETVKNNEGEDDHDLTPKPILQKVILLTKNGKIIDQKNVEALNPTTYKNGNHLQLSPGDGSIITSSRGKLQYSQGSTIESVAGTKLVIDYNKTVFLINERGILYSSQEVLPFESYQPKALFDDDINNSDSSTFLIESGEPGESEALVFLYNNTTPFKQQAQAIDSFLLSKGFLPSEFRFSWAKISATDGMPVTPNIIVIK